MQDVVPAEVLKLLQACIIYPISDSPWVSPTKCTKEVKDHGGPNEKEKKLLHASLQVGGDMVEQIMEVSWTDITIYGSTFEECLVNLEAVLNRCIQKTWCSTGRNAIYGTTRNFPFPHHLREGIEVDKAKVELLSNFHP
ncbi:hypothetical protein CK203_065965 [Vitis vinifera]|uniref:Uncharacterized protein n=1 Tax=Vitis vinifera TaxID=29760 RepID=A0A438FNF9_VITVI|nr:hypothetical protein CK203_065965 [Vitis vinifera]